jgi:hypothetical protein
MNQAALPCPYRTDLSHDGEHEFARCDLIAGITGIKTAETPLIRRDMCEACLKTSPPNKLHLNPVVASPLFLFAKKIADLGGHADCDLKRAQKIKNWAMNSLTSLCAASEGTRRAPKYEGSCIYLGEKLGDRLCDTCRGNVRLKVFKCAHPFHPDTTIRNCQSCNDYEPQHNVGQIKKWSVGMTTAPRRQPTLEQTVASIQNAGWDGENEIQIFAEPGTRIPKSIQNAQIFRRKEKLGAWPNWFLALTEMVLRDPLADAYLMLQDDAVFCSGLREYLERTLWPANKTGVVSLHTPSHHSRGEMMGFFPLNVGWGAWGAMAFVFPNAIARAILSDPKIVSHRNRGMGEGMHNVDSLIGDWCRRREFPYFLHSPSLAEHIGFTTTLWKHDSLKGRRSSSDFPGQDFDLTKFTPVAESLEPAATIESPSPSPTLSLAIATVHIGRLDCYDAWEKWLLTATLPKNTAIYLIDNSGDNPDFQKTLHETAAKISALDSVTAISIIKGPGPAKADSARLSTARMQSFSDALNLIYDRSREDLILTIDDDVIPPADAVEKLMATYHRLQGEGHDIGVISGCYESANAHGHLVACRSNNGWSGRIKKDELDPSEIIPIGIVGNGCCLAKTEYVREILPISPKTPGDGRVLGPDGYLCSSLHANGHSIWLHGGVVCDHLF